MTNSLDPDQTAPMGAVCSGSTLFASILNLSVMLGSYLQQTTSADDNFRYNFFFALRVYINNNSLAHFCRIDVLLWIFNVIVLSCVCYVFVHLCLFVLCGHLLGKGGPLGSRLLCLTVSLSLSHWYPGSGVVLDCIDS